MFYNERKQQIIVAGFLPRGKKVLVVRSKEMPNKICKAEYYNIPAWTLPFGKDPVKYLETTFNEFFNIKTKVTDMINATSYLQDEKNSHNVLITFMMTSKNDCNKLKNCKNISFINREDINSYVLSDRLKQIIIDGFNLLD